VKHQGSTTIKFEVAKAESWLVDPQLLPQLSLCRSQTQTQTQTQTRRGRWCDPGKGNLELFA
jgi:hypothetical protein